MNYTRNIWLLYLNRFFHNLIPAYVIERLFWEQRGMTVQMVVYTEIIYAITIVLLEIPTGVIADRWGRKKMMVIGAIIGCSEFVLLVFANSFWQFGLVVFLAGVSRSASSGSENALLYDSLKANGKEQDFEKVIGRLNVFDYSAAIIAALSGGFLANRFDFELNYWISFVSMLIALAAVLMLVEPYHENMAAKEIKPAEYISRSLRFFKRNPSVCIAIVTGMFAGSCLNYLDEFWQIYFNGIPVPVLYFGLFSAGFILSRLPGNMFAYMLIKKYKYKTLLSGVLIIITAGFLVISALPGYIGIAAMFLVYIASGIVEPVVSGYLHHRADSEMRATIDSFQSLGLRGVNIIVGLCFGYFSTYYSIFKGFGFIGILCVIYFMVYIVVPINDDNKIRYSKWGKT